MVILKKTHWLDMDHFYMVKNRSFVKTDIANNAYSVLQKQPDRSLRRQFRSHYRSDGYAVAPVDPTRGFLLSLI